MRLWVRLVVFGCAGMLWAATCATAADSGQPVRGPKAAAAALLARASADDLRRLCYGDCGLIDNADLRRFCRGDCGLIDDPNLRRLCYGSCGLISR